MADRTHMSWPMAAAIVTPWIAATLVTIHVGAITGGVFAVFAAISNCFMADSDHG